MPAIWSFSSTLILPGILKSPINGCLPGCFGGRTLTISGCSTVFPQTMHLCRMQLERCILMRFCWPPEVFFSGSGSAGLRGRSFGSRTKRKPTGGFWKATPRETSGQSMQSPDNAVNKSRHRMSGTKGNSKFSGWCSSGLSSFDNYACVASPTEIP